MGRRLRTFIIVLLPCSLTTLLALYQLNYPLTGIDDANIYFVYARNLAHGHGFVYNAGGERVEGFTSLLWTLLEAPVFKFSPRPELTLLSINIILLGSGIACALDYLQNEFFAGDNNKRAALIGAGVFLSLLVTSPRYILWNTITLMENSLWSTLLVITTIFAITDHSSSKALNLGFIPLSVALLLTRPESILWTPFLAAILFIRRWSASSARSALRDLAPSFVSIVITLVLLTLFRLTYFGYPLPNTFYAKVSPSIAYDLQQGTKYLAAYFKSDLIAGISVITVLIGIVRMASRLISGKIPNDGPAFLPVIAGMGLVMPALTGGDHFGSFRFYQNIFPITLLCLFHVVYPYIRDAAQPDQPGQKSMFLGLILAALAIALNQFTAWTRFAPEIGSEFDVARYERRNGTLIQELFSPLPDLPSIGVIASGGIKYSYSGEIIDLMGLNNTIMAHNHGERTGYKNHAAFEIATFYKLQPEIVWPKEVIKASWQFNEDVVMQGWENREGLKGLFDDPRFQASYAFARVARQTAPEKGYALVAWFRKDFLRALAANAEYQIETYIDIP